MAAGDMIFVFKGVSSGTWRVPTGVSAIKVECFGGAADFTFNSNNSIPAQVGGSYSQTSTLSVIAGSTIYFSVSTAGNTWINKTSNAVPTSTTDGCLAVGANTAASLQVAANVGNIRNAGGDGVGWSTVGSISGRGGQAGPNGAGANSGPVYSNTPYSGFYGSYLIGNGGGANGGVSGGLFSIPYGRSGGAFGGDGGYWNGSDNISATQDILGQAQYLNGYPVAGTLNYGPFGGAQAVWNGTSGENDAFLISGQQSFIVITVIETTQKSIVFGGGLSGSFTLPSDFLSLISLRAWGSAGLSSGGDVNNNGGGGGGATYSETVAASITATMNAGSTVVYYSTGTPFGNTRSYINIGINSNQPLVTTGVLAFNGNNSSGSTGGTASASSNVGTTVRAGGTGGAGPTGARNTGGGGGGAGGPLGAGAIGGNAAQFVNRGGGGGGASNGGSAGGNATTTLSGAGGSITGGSGGTGATASVAATAGTNGGGSGGGYATTYGNPPKGSILSFENGLYHINGGTGGDGGRDGNINSGGEGGGPVTVSADGTLYYLGGMVVLTYVPTQTTSGGNFFFLF